MGVTVSVSKVPEDPGFPRGSQCTQAAWEPPAELGVQLRAPVPLSLLPETEELADTGCWFTGGTWGLAFVSFTFAQ